MTISNWDEYHQEQDALLDSWNNVTNAMCDEDNVDINDWRKSGMMYMELSYILNDFPLIINCCISASENTRDVNYKNPIIEDLQALYDSKLSDLDNLIEWVDTVKYQDYRLGRLQGRAYDYLIAVKRYISGIINSLR